MKIYCQFAEHKNALRAHFGARITFVDTPLEADYLLSGRFKQSDFHPDLQGVIIPYTGHDQIDLEAMRAHQLRLFNVTGHSKFVAERAMQLLHALTGKIVTYHNRLKVGDWSGRMTHNRMAWDSLFHKRVGLYGYGRIGKYVHALLQPFDVTCVVIDRGKNYHGVHTVADLSAMVKTTDIVIISTPLTETTEGAFNQAIFRTFKAGWLINVGRGKIVDEGALREALMTGELRGYASDVWFNYPKDTQPTFPVTPPLHTLDNVVMTPHCGGHTTTSFSVMIAEIINHIEALLNQDYTAALDLDRLS